MASEMTALLEKGSEDDSLHFEDFVLNGKGTVRVPATEAGKWKRVVLRSILTKQYWIISGVIQAVFIVYLFFPFLFPFLTNIMTAVSVMYIISEKYIRKNTSSEMFSALGKSFLDTFIFSLIDTLILCCFFLVITLIFVVGHVTDFYDLVIRFYQSGEQNGIKPQDACVWGVRLVGFSVGCFFGFFYYFIKAFTMPLIVLGNVPVFRAMFMSISAVRKNFIHLLPGIVLYSMTFSLLMLVAVNFMFMVFTGGIMLYLTVIMNLITGILNDNIVSSLLALLVILAIPIITLIVISVWPGLYHVGQAESAMDIFWSHIKTKKAADDNVSDAEFE